MKFALDKNGKRISIFETNINENYYCPICNEKLITKRGEIRTHHFAHYSSGHCHDTWHYDMSDWHINWQNEFHIDVQEVVKELNGKKHRADILLEDCKTVIEFQHSSLSADEFVERNYFYNQLGYKVVWVFDLEEQFDNIEELDRKANRWKWKRPLSTFNYTNELNPNVEIYFQFANDENEEKDRFKNDCWILRVSWISPKGFKWFATKESYTRKEFLLLFEKYTIDNIEYDISEAYDDLKLLYSKDHTQYYLGCELSKTNMCCNSTIDLPKSRYDDIKPCSLCEYKNIYLSGCRKRVMDLDLPSDTIVKKIEKYNNGSLKRIDYLENQQIKSIYFELLDFKGDGDSIISLWNKNKIERGVFKNIKTGYYVKIISNPSNTIAKYGKCYGYLSKDEYKFSNNTVEVYGYNNKEWILVWSR